MEQGYIRGWCWWCDDDAGQGKKKWHQYIERCDTFIVKLKIHIILLSDSKYYREIFTYTLMILLFTFLKPLITLSPLKLVLNADKNQAHVTFFHRISLQWSLFQKKVKFL